MKIGVLGANGRLGSIVCQEVLRKNHELYAIIPNGVINNKNIKNVWNKSLFDLTKDDLLQLDVLISCFGSGFDVDPKINRDALNHLGKLSKETNRRVIMIGGAGVLFTDSTHKNRVYETKDHPDFLKGISKNLALGLQDLKEMSGVNYTLVCPSLFFDYEGKKLGSYQVGTEEEVIYDSKGQSRISYQDLAVSMVDEAETGRYINKCITICEV